MTEEPTENELVHDSDDSVLMLYDGDCGFCTYWAKRWKQKVGPSLEIAPLQDAERRPERLSLTSLEEQLHTVESDGTIRRGAEAVFSALSSRPGFALGWWCYRYLPGFRWISEFAYRLVANHRMQVSRWTRWMRRKDVGS